MPQREIHQNNLLVLERSYYLKGGSLMENQQSHLNWKNLNHLLKSKTISKNNLKDK
jgi:hypothetical protein